MLFDLKNEYQIPKFKEYVNKLFEQRAVVEVVRKLPNRSLAQNSYLYLILGWFASETGYSIDEVKIDYFKKLCNKEIFVRTKVNKFGNEISYVRSSAELTTGEMTTAIERFRNYASSEAGIYLPAPNENDFLLYIRQEIEKQKEYL